MSGQSPESQPSATSAQVEIGQASHDRFGVPIGEVLRRGDWVFCHYERGAVCRHPNLGTHDVPDPIRAYWKSGLIVTLGFPVGDPRDIVLARRALTVMDFEHGGIYWDHATGVVFDVREGQEAGPYLLFAVALVGKWDAPLEPGVVGVHAALLHTNRVLFWSYRDTLADFQHAGNFHVHPVVAEGEWSVLSLASRTQVVPRTISDRNQFCGGQCLLGDGKVLAVGGDRHHPFNHRTVRVFDPAIDSWELPLPDLEEENGRWYPTLVTLGANTALIVAGDHAPEPDGLTEPDPRYHRANPTVQLIAETGITTPPHAFDGQFYDRKSATYPFVFVLPGGRLFVHLGRQTRLLALPGIDFASASTERLENHFGSRTYGQQGTAVLLPLRPTDTPPYRARVMLIGGGAEAEPPLGTEQRKSCEILDLGQSLHQWRPAAPMTHARVMPDSVLLPDGQVLVVNGARRGETHHASEPVYEAEVYDPATNRWTELARMKSERLYHATALLLPDARVLTAGTDREWNSSEYGYAHTQLEVFSPPYLFQGSRPEIKSAPERIGYGQTFFVTTEQAASIKSAVLIRNGSCTHSFNPDQRLIELEIVRRVRRRLSVALERVQVSLRSAAVSFLWPHLLTGPGLELRAPPDEYVAPAGYYMLFLVDAKGAPSVAKFVRLAPGGDPFFTFEWAAPIRRD